MTKKLWQSPAIALLTAAAVIFSTAAYAQTQPAKPAKPAQQKPAQPAAPAQKKPPKADPTEQVVLLGQFGDWGAYTASPGSKKVCFALAKPASSETSPPNRPRNPSYMFISTRPADKGTDEVSIIIGYPFKPGSEATAEVGATTFALYTQ